VFWKTSKIMLSAPYSLLINKSGTITGIYYGFSDKIFAQIEEKLKMLLVE
ncbi:MAG: hypothetical protein HGB26_07955, partial [Desulfobulbaceae bacterium]|nr:hypothetical protein [Desulfobulbaceae bacterium]